MGSPAITFSRLPTVSMSKTTIGMRFSLHRAVAVRSITLSPRLYTSSYVISLNFVAVGSFSGSEVYMPSTFSQLTLPPGLRRVYVWDGACLLYTHISDVKRKL